MIKIYWLGILFALTQSLVCRADSTEFLKQYCVDCHNGEWAEADFRVDLLTHDLDSDFDAWALIQHRIETGEMPPSDAERPPSKELSQFLTALTDSLVDVDAHRKKEFGRRELRRLSRTEYSNSLKDLLALPHLEIEDMLPPDGRAHGFQKSANALDFSHVMIARYLEIADHALRKALVTRPDPIPSRTIRAELKSTKGVRETLQTLAVQLKLGHAIPLVGKERDPTLVRVRGNFKKREQGSVTDPEPRFDGVLTMMNDRFNQNIVIKPFEVPQSGYYKIRVHGWGAINDRGKVVPSDRTETVAFYSKSGRLLGRCDLPPNEPTTSEVTAWLNEGEPVEYLAISTEFEKFNFPSKSDPKYEAFKAYGIALQWFELEGPLPQAWPPESHRQLFGDLQLKASKTRITGSSRQINRTDAGASNFRVITKTPEADADKLLRSFAQRAYRRPIRPADLKVPMEMVRQRLSQNQTFTEAMLAGYRAILTSPDFLLLLEEPGELGSWELATRLSCFLSNSTPDGPLKALARRGELLERDVLRRETDRLLEAPEVQRFVVHFLGNWLDLRNITLTQPDENLYPEFNVFLTESMVEETKAFFTEMLHKDLPTSNIVDSDFLMINQRLAELYGLDGVSGSEIRKVAIDENSVRGGLLTQASLLKITANGTTTSPVVRGTFVLSRLLGDEPPPPPPSVPAIEPDISGATTIREQLAAHRSIEQCAGCHQKIDPPGFALENFDVMGGWRDRYRAIVKASNGASKVIEHGQLRRYRMGLPVESHGELENGQSFADISEFRALLKLRQRKLARNLLEQLIVYATGEPVGFADRAEVEAMMDSLESSNYGVRSMVHAIVQSDLFRHK
ncbi:MAG: DUF1592 domain-containing protein [Planctomycetota bacterium]